ncbi:MAG: PqqD family protein, partial [Acidobacteria bacterium]
KSGVYLGLDSVGTRIWNLLQQHRVLQEVRDAMLQEYEVSADQCERDLLRLVGEMEQQGLAEVGT